MRDDHIAADRQIVLHRKWPDGGNSHVAGRAGLFDHPVFAWLGLRPARAQHTVEESRALSSWARNKKCIVEIGVAEGASALALRRVLHSEGALHLIDPFHLTRLRFLNSVRRVARKTVSHCATGRVEWIEEFSDVAVRKWDHIIDFLFLDGDHREDAVQRDWENWSRFVRLHGIVALHDARIFPGGWTSESDGPVKLVDRLFRSGSPSAWEIVDEVHSLVFARRCGT
jgi:predicted O-methyltransferase YrrM